MLSAILYGLRTSLMSPGSPRSSRWRSAWRRASAPPISARFVDTVIMRVVDLQLGFPSILIALILLALLGRGVDKVILALVLVQWAYYARVVRASALVESRKDYIAAARCLALSHPPHHARGICCPTACRR